MKLKDIFLFDKMLGPKLVTLSYWVLLIASVMNAGLLLGTMTEFSLVSAWRVLVPQLFTLLSSLLLIRVGCELVVVLFRIHADIKRLADETTPKPSHRHKD